MLLLVIIIRISISRAEDALSNNIVTMIVSVLTDCAIELVVHVLGAFMHHTQGINELVAMYLLFRRARPGRAARAARSGRSGGGTRICYYVALYYLIIYIYIYTYT